MKRDRPRPRLVSERDVRAAARNGTSIDIAGAVVTPAARDVALQLGVVLHIGEPAPAASANAPGHHGTEIKHAKKVSLGSDHGGFKLKEALKPLIRELGFEIADVGCRSADPVDYPVFAARVAEQVAAGEVVAGIMVDGAGIGSAMVANKIAGVRAALCYDLTTARNAREHNNANVLTLGGGLIGERLAQDIVRLFLTTPFAAGRHVARVAMIDALDR